MQTLYYDRVLRQLWMGTFNSGLLRMDLHTGCLSKMYTSYSALMNPIRAISEYDSDNLLIGIDGGGVYAVGKTVGNVFPLFTIDDDIRMSLKEMAFMRLLKIIREHLDWKLYGRSIGGCIAKISDRGIYA